MKDDSRYLPRLSSVVTRHSSPESWQPAADSNREPPASEADALPIAPAGSRPLSTIRRRVEFRPDFRPEFPADRLIACSTTKGGDPVRDLIGSTGLRGSNRGSTRTSMEFDQR